MSHMTPTNRDTYDRNYSENELKNLLIKQIKNEPYSFKHASRKVARKLGFGFGSTIFNRLLLIKNNMVRDGEFVKERNGAYSYTGDQFFCGNILCGKPFLHTPTLKENMYDLF